jgi:hypothetical protein
VTDIVIGAEELAALPASLIHATRTACSRMGLTNGDEEAVMWGSTRIAELARQIGRQLYDALPPDLIEPVADVGYLPVERTTPQFCIWIPASREPELPWELGVGDGINRTPWGLDERIGIAYRARWNEPVAAELSLHGPLNVVVASCMPAGVPSANVDAQRITLARNVAGLPPAWATRHAWYENPSFDTLRTAISHGTTLLHVLAHGRPGEILWHEAGSPNWLTAESFCGEFEGAELALASFCVCDSATRRDRLTPSLAETASRRFARSSVGVRGLLPDTAATAYLQGLLRSLSSGSPRVDRMVTDARGYIATSDRSQHWVRPTLFVRDGMVRLQLVPARRMAAREPAVSPTRSYFLIIGEERIQLGAPLTSVGRSAAADVVVSRAGIAPFQIVVDISTEPAEVRDQTGEGVRVNGSSVPWAKLADGDVLGFGDVRLTYQTESAHGG